MEVIEHAHLRIGDPSGAGQTRRVSADLARKLDFGTDDIGRVELVATEVSTNMVKHAGGGEVFVRALSLSGRRGLELLAVDRGPGMSNLREAMRDGFSSAGSGGHGLGAMARLSSQLDVYSQPGVGTVLFARIWSAPPPTASGLQLGALNVRRDGEEVSGDGWAARCDGRRTLLMLADGLGHGPLAARAAEAAAAAFQASAPGGPAAILERIHAALRPTRGAAVAVAEIDAVTGVLCFAGIGNVAGTVTSGGTSRSLVSLNGIAGHHARSIREFSYPWPRDALLVLHSDGVSSRWSLASHPGLEHRDPTLVAAVLYRDYARCHDDAAVLAVREAA